MVSRHSVKKNCTFTLPGRVAVSAPRRAHDSRDKQLGRWVGALAVPLLFWVSFGTAAASVAQEETVPTSADAVEYQIQLGDELGIKFFYNSDLNEEVVVRPDGRISLQLIPEVVAFGKTPIELGTELRELYSAELDRPAITVLVRTFSAQRIYVDGEVEKPGELSLIGPLTVMQAIARGGGTKPSARLKEVIVIRRGLDGRPTILPVNLNHARNGTDPSQDIALLPYDVVYVPQTQIANVNKWIDQYLRQNIPFSFGFRIEIQ
jgi:protein involved in polysaccharide export with SLBB domain